MMLPIQKIKPLAGHRCLGARPAVEVNCECGWVSCPHSGEGARAAAYSEWRSHARSHGAEEEPLQVARSREEREQARLEKKYAIRAALSKPSTDGATQ